jgi:hypothetical protein
LISYTGRLGAIWEVVAGAADQPGKLGVQVPPPGLPADPAEDMGDCRAEPGGRSCITPWESARCIRPGSEAGVIARKPGARAGWYLTEPSAYPPGARRPGARRAHTTRGVGRRPGSGDGLEEVARGRVT